MKAASRIAASLLFTSAPALATGTIHCTTPDRAGLELFISVSHSAAAGIAQVRLVDGGRESVTGAGGDSPQLTQNWVDPLELKLDIADANVENLIARVEARRSTDSGPYVGTLRYGERQLRISCLWDEDEG